MEWNIGTDCKPSWFWKTIACRHLGLGQCWLNIVIDINLRPKVYNGGLVYKVIYRVGHMTKSDIFQLKRFQFESLHYSWKQCISVTNNFFLFDFPIWVPKLGFPTKISKLIFPTAISAYHHSMLAAEIFLTPVVPLWYIEPLRKS